MLCSVCGQVNLLHVVYSLVFSESQTSEVSIEDFSNEQPAQSPVEPAAVQPSLEATAGKYTPHQPIEGMVSYIPDSLEYAHWQCTLFLWLYVKLKQC